MSQFVHVRSAPIVVPFLDFEFICPISDFFKIPQLLRFCGFGCLV